MKKKRPLSMIVWCRKTSWRNCSMGPKGKKLHCKKCMLRLTFILTYWFLQTHVQWTITNESIKHSGRIGDIGCWTPGPSWRIAEGDRCGLEAAGDIFPHHLTITLDSHLIGTLGCPRCWIVSIQGRLQRVEFTIPQVGGMATHIDIV